MTRDTMALTREVTPLIRRAADARRRIAMAYERTAAARAELGAALLQLAAARADAVRVHDRYVAHDDGVTEEQVRAAYVSAAELAERVADSIADASSEVL